MKKYTCCFFGHREIRETDKFKADLQSTIESLITNENIHTFLFGSKSRFDELCLETVTKLKEKYPHVKRIYVRAEYPVISDSYRAYLLTKYDDTYYPESIKGAGMAVYVERNRDMIQKSRYCIVYFDENNTPKTRKSGTKIALDHAVKLNKEIIVFS